uniref:DDE Tnp4 domain-containing protein n=1 Tax=Oncorhynchus tshawytscha TaxID=74940 RepID=A0AAZ3QVL4_ONCTS
TINYRTPVEPKQRLAVTLRYLASGDSICSLFFTYRLGFETFHEKWDFPNCLGSVDGKHIMITKQPNSGRPIQVGDFGRKSDGEVYANSPLGRAIASKTLQVPQDAFLLGGKDLGKIPYIMVGDAAFPLKPYLMRPYAGHNISYQKEIFNYRLCRVDTLCGYRCMRGIAIQASRAGQEAVSVREKFTKYFTSVEGRIDFQDRMVAARPT